MSEDALRTQLAQWLDLSLEKKVPPSLLLLSRALLLPDRIPTSDQLKATISVLPDTVVSFFFFFLIRRVVNIRNLICTCVISAPKPDDIVLKSE